MEVQERAGFSHQRPVNTLSELVGLSEARTFVLNKFPGAAAAAAAATESGTNSENHSSPDIFF